MCRLLGVVSSETTTFRFSLHEAPRSLSTLSRDHPHGWGLAVHARDSHVQHGWSVNKQAACAADDKRFSEVAHAARGEILLAHIRKATVGETRQHNTHPFQRGRWIFAHNGTITDMAFLAQHTSTERAREIEGDTDSERYFAYLLTAMDGASEGKRDGALRSALDRARAQPAFGAANFLMSNGELLYAFRKKRTLFVLERGTADPVRSIRDSVETLARLETPWSARRHAMLVASERMTDEPWQELDEGALLRIDAGSSPRCTPIHG
jgi:predicted glutamine amidotransferase